MTVNTAIGTLTRGDRVVISGTLVDEFTRTIISVTKTTIKVVGPITFDVETLRRHDFAAHQIIAVTEH